MEEEPVAHGDIELSQHQDIAEPLVGQSLLRGGSLSWDSRVTENTLEMAFLHHRSETNPGHKLSGEEMHNRSLLPRGNETEMDKRYRKKTLSAFCTSLDAEIYLVGHLIS